MEKTQIVQKFNGMANTFGVFGKLIEKALVEDIKPESHAILSEISTMLIKEINDLTDAFKLPTTEN